MLRMYYVFIALELLVIECARVAKADPKLRAARTLTAA